MVTTASMKRTLIFSEIAVLLAAIWFGCNVARPPAEPGHPSLETVTPSATAGAIDHAHDGSGGRPTAEYETLTNLKAKWLHAPYNQFELTPEVIALAQESAEPLLCSPEMLAF